jgi:O-antigen ligase
MLPALDTAAAGVAVWRAILVSGTVSSLALTARFAYKWRFHISGADPVVYLRGGGLLHHWMVYATVEAVVVAGLLEFWRAYPEHRRWAALAACINAVAIILSLTRMLWVCSFLLVAAHLIWNRSRWVWVLPALPLALYLLAPGPIRTRVSESFQADYYSNAERVQMLRVGWRVVRDKPLTGVGPGRVEQLYSSYLAPGESLPAYHGHLHNNLAEIAAESGLFTLAAAAVFVALLFRDLFRRLSQDMDRNSQFLCRAGILGLAGFLAAGMVDYTYGHSVGLIVTCFAVLAPLSPVSRRPLQLQWNSLQRISQSLFFQTALTEDSNGSLRRCPQSDRRGGRESS